MDKLYVYLPDGLLPKIAELAKKEKRSLSHISVELMGKGLEDNPTPKSKSAIELPEDLQNEVKDFANEEERSVEQMTLILIRQAIKEKRRREKYLKSTEKK